MKVILPQVTPIYRLNSKHLLGSYFFSFFLLSELVSMVAVVRDGFFGSIEENGGAL